MIRRLFILSLSVLAFACQPKNKDVQSVNIIPQPSDLQLSEGTVKWGDLTGIVANEQFSSAVNEFKKELGLRQLHNPEFISGSDAKSKFAIQVKLADGLPAEAYELNINTNAIQVKATDASGCHYAFQSLLQILPIKSSGQDIYLPCLEIKDQPRFKYRGMHVDVSRHFFTQEELIRFIDVIAQYKINRLHLHLTDDQGWRIEIKKYPLLTQKGAWRTHNNQDSICMKRALDDATFELPEDRYQIIDGEKKYGGFYTQEQMREIIAYAGKKHITIVPEIDVPGHFMAAIDNYPYLSCSGKSGWGEKFSLPACLGKESTYTFIEDVLGEMAELFPGEYIHIGGDEVNIKSWTTCKKCQAAIKKEKLIDEHHLQTHFNKHIETFLNSKGKKLLGWDEIAQGGLTDNATVMWWRNWAPTMRNIAANNGNDLIMTPDFEYYFDFPHRATPLKKVYNNEPVPKDFISEMAKYVIGVQANLWSERIPNINRMFFMSLPRMLALAETGWTAKDKKDFDGFNKRVESQYNRFDAQNLFYHLPPIHGFSKQNAFIDNASLEITIPLNDMDVYYTLDGSTPTPESAKYEGPVTISESCTVKLRSYRNEVFSEVFETTFEKQVPLEAVQLENVVHGLKRYSQKGHFSKLADIPAANKHTKSTSVDNINLGEFKGISESFALVFEGYFFAPKEGVYTFSTSSDDGDQLFLHDQVVVDNKGSHTANKRSGMIALKKGYHPLKHLYRQLGNSAALKVWVSIPDEEKRETKKSDWAKCE